MKTLKQAAIIGLIFILAVLGATFPSQATATAIHLPAPKIVKGVYIEFGDINSTRFWNLAGMTERTELNTFVIDIRSTGGPLLYNLSDSAAQKLLAKLHQKNIYLIARIVCFNAGGSWYDPASRTRWNQIAEASRRAISIGFDEINYDYVRYGAAYETQLPTPVSERNGIIRSFFEFLKSEVRDKTGHPISVDIFGEIMLWNDDGIGQKLKDAAENFDYVMPMVYPSHWGYGNFGLDVPAHHPYKSVHQNLSGWSRVINDPKRIASLRPWLQAFDLDSISPVRYYHYGRNEVREQMRACYDTGCTGWVLWNAATIYKENFFETK